MALDPIRSQPFLHPDQEGVLDNYRTILELTDRPPSTDIAADDYLRVSTEDHTRLVSGELAVAAATSLPVAPENPEQFRQNLAWHNWQAVCSRLKFGIAANMQANYAGLAQASGDIEVAQSAVQLGSSIIDLNARLAATQLLSALSKMYPEIHDENSAIWLAQQIFRTTNRTTAYERLTQQDADMFNDLLGKIRQLESTETQTQLELPIPDVSPDANKDSLNSFVVGVEESLLVHDMEEDGIALEDPDEFVDYMAAQIGALLLKLDAVEMGHVATMAGKVVSLIIEAAQIRNPAAADHRNALIAHYRARGIVFLWDNLGGTNPDREKAQFRLQVEAVAQSATT